MIRRLTDLIHRRCRHQIEGLADAAHHQTRRAEDLAEDLAVDEMAHSYLLDEIRDACKNPDHIEEASIPEVLRERLIDHQIAERELNETVEHLVAEQARVTRALDHILTTAHEQGRLARTYALMEGSELGPRDGLAAWLARTQITGWTGFPGWPCQDTDCTYTTRDLVWHPGAPDRAHLSCSCGRVWPAGPGAVERAVRETESCQVGGGSVRTSQRWSHMSSALLEAIDRALPTPAQIRDREDREVVPV